MKPARTILNTAICTSAIVFSASIALGHNLWVKGANDEVFKADMIYGHHFPTPEKIQEERVSIFTPVTVAGKDFHETLTQKGEAYHYEGASKLQEGTYLLRAFYQPTSWVKTKGGKWLMGKTRKDAGADVESCAVWTMVAKSVVTIGDDDGAYAVTPFADDFQITPLVKASDIEVGKAVEFQLTHHNKPVKMTEVKGNFAGYTESNMSMPFWAKTDLEGKFTFKALSPGLWYLEAEIETPSGDNDCETLGSATTLVFEVQDSVKK